MKDDEKKVVPIGIIEHVQDPRDLSWRVETHGAHCARTREVYEAFARGEAPRHPDHPQAARCGPAKVTTDAYRDGWDGLFGARQPRGEA